MKEREVLSLIEETSDMIADYYGMKVPYYLSMDMSFFPHLIFAMLDNEKPCLHYLRFLAANGRLLPKGLATATMNEFKKYCKGQKQEILNEIIDICRKYQKEITEWF